MTIDLSAAGRLTVHPFVSERKVQFMGELIEKAVRGNEHARVDLKESIATSDAAFSLAHLINIRNLPEYDKAPREWNKIAQPFEVDNFKDATWYNIKSNFGALKYGKGNNGEEISPRVAEGDTYQNAYGYSEESLKFAIEKRGFKVGLTLEDIINDVTGIIRQLPSDMLNIALDTDEYLVFRKLQDGVTSATQVAAATLPDGTAVTHNAPFSAAALRAALAQRAARKVDGRAVTINGGSYIVVASGQGDYVRWEMERSLIQIVDGDLVYKPTGSNPFAGILGVIESEWIDDADAWYVVPAAGATRRPSLLKLNLAGRTAPEVLVNNFTGQLIAGGGGSSPFDLAHFDNDTVDLKLRQFTNAGLLTEEAIVWSNGSGV
jgi:hypothetical protein